MALYGTLFFIIFTVLGVDNVPRTVGIIQPIILFILVGGSRAFASYWLSNSYRKQLKLSAVPHVLIYGAGEAGRQLMGALLHSYEMRVVGFLDDDIKLQGSTLVGKRIYSPQRLIDLSASLNVSEVLLAMPSISRFRRNQIIKMMREARVSVRTLPSMSDLASGRVSTQDLRPLDIDDLLGRELVLPRSNLLSKNSHQKIVMVTGAGGSIGSELCRQILEQQPMALILLDQSEFSLYKIHQELIGRAEKIRFDKQVKIIPVLGSVTDASRIRLILEKYEPHIIYHAAAYKHVPLVEENSIEGVKNNAIGTLVVAKLAGELGVPNFILISTDKAVRPTNVMGASKRLAEMVLQALTQITPGTKFAMVRFGNVLDSSGSVVPKFRQQIKDGGPITVTDFRITRYFMTIPEAAQLVIQAGALAVGGDVFLLDMGQPVRILDLALQMIHLSGLDLKNAENPEGDIEIQEIGLRPGEKLYEELLIDGSPEKTLHPRIFKSYEEYLSWDKLEKKISIIQASIENDDQHTLLAALQELAIGFTPNDATKSI
jgi:FlaA1/EpsC-like NDP-sugar epimerase